MLRISIRSLMAFVVLAAVGLAALKDPGDIWAGLLMLAALLALGFAVQAAVLLRGRERAWSFGFAFFGIAYLMIAFDTALTDTFKPHLGTTALMETVFYNVAQGIQGVEETRAWEGQLPQFMRIGHSLFTLLFSLLGGMSAAWLYGRRERREA